MTAAPPAPPDVWVPPTPERPPRPADAPLMAPAATLPPELPPALGAPPDEPPVAATPKPPMPGSAPPEPAFPSPVDALSQAIVEAIKPMSRTECLIALPILSLAIAAREADPAGDRNRLTVDGVRNGVFAAPSTSCTQFPS